MAMFKRGDAVLIWGKKLGTVHSVDIKHLRNTADILVGFVSDGGVPVSYWFEETALKHHPPLDTGWNNPRIEGCR